jgi:hypothetical protein
MTERAEALRLAEYHEGLAAIPPISREDGYLRRTAAELRRLHHNNQVLKDALWRACGDDEEAVNATIASEGELK